MLDDDVVHAAARGLIKLLSSRGAREEQQPLAIRRSGTQLAPSAPWAAVLALFVTVVVGHWPPVDVLVLMGILAVITLATGTEAQ